MDLEKEFEKIRPYKDSEVPLAIKALLKHEKFESLLPSLAVGRETKEVLSLLNSVKTIYDFQKHFSQVFLEHIIKTTSDGFSFSGLENIKDKGHLFIANHRDIILDTAFLQMLLHENDMPTSQITVGDNLMKNSLFSLLGKLNKVFTLKRGGGRIEMYKNAVIHSRYINKTVLKNNESMWIAQRDGRTKNGDDKTQQGLLKMLLGDRRDVAKALEELAIVPVSISYEFEPCIKGKIREVYQILKEGNYEKQENEDMKSSVQSIFAPKGRIHLSFGNRLNRILEGKIATNLSNNEIVNLFVQEIDKQIHSNYKLWPNNYIAFDLLEQKSRFKEQYSKEQYENFNNYISKTIQELDGNIEDLKKIALEIYANPVKNKENIA
jgi:hypothetical protein